MAEQDDARLALQYHKTVEGEYGCPGVGCPGVQRVLAQLEVRASLPNDTSPVLLLRSRARWYEHGCQGLEDLEGYWTSGALFRDVAGDLTTALDLLAAAWVEAHRAPSEETRHADPRDRIDYWIKEAERLRASLEERTRQLEVIRAKFAGTERARAHWNRLAEEWRTATVEETAKRRAVEATLKAAQAAIENARRHLSAELDSGFSMPQARHIVEHVIDQILDPALEAALTASPAAQKK